MSPLHVVTGAYGYIGRHIAARLLERGYTVRTLTGRVACAACSGQADSFGSRVEVRPYNWDDPAALARSLKGAEVLYNTYWVRFEHGGTTFGQAVERSRRLFDAARAAGVRRVVHVSVTKADPGSPLPYYRGKGLVERSLSESGLSWAILRPNVVFGDGGILINNIAWLLRRHRVFAVPAGAPCPVQPVAAGDLADLAVDLGQEDTDICLDAVGPEVYPLADLARLVAAGLGLRRKVIAVPPRVAHACAWLLGWRVNDVVLTWEEVQGLRAGLLASDGPPTCPTRLSDWLRDHAGWLGREWFSELDLHYRRREA